MTQRQFKVMVDWRHPEIKHAASVPWDIVAPHEAQAKRNHYQTLERLNERGGLGVVELWHVVNDQDWTGKLPCGARVTFGEAVDWLKQLLASREPLPEPVKSTQPQTGHSAPKAKPSGLVNTEKEKG